MSPGGKRILLALDVGNSRIHAARYEGDRLVERRDLAADGDPGPLAPLHAGADGVAIASVNPPASARLVAWLRTRDQAPVTELRHESIPLVNRTAEPARVGIDRLLNAYGAWRRAGRGCLVASLGSAITLDAVDRNGAFLGGAILPGLKTGLDALHDRCAQLPALAPERPTAALGRSTREAMLSGVVQGAAGAILHLAARMREEVGEDLAGYLTGGDAELIAPLLSGFGVVAPDLALDAIRQCAAFLK